MSDHEACRKADDTNVWVGVRELQERVALLERELAEAKQKLERKDVCWHCNCVLELQLPRCNDCPDSVDDCVEYPHCNRPGCLEFRSGEG